MNTSLALQTLAAAAEAGDYDGFEAHAAALRALVGDALLAVERDLPRHLEGGVSPLPETGQHLLLAGGKRVRPILTLLSAAIAGRPGPIARNLAAAGELVHLATLMHDDVIDDADRRRGEPTPRVVWSNTASVLGGDYALTRALDLVATAPTTAPLREAIETLRLLVEGEILQLRHRELGASDVDAYNAIIDRKTASLFRWCCRAGAHLGDDDALVDALGRYGYSVGRCFQIVDDVLDFDESADSGKDPLADLREGKLTLPLLLAIRRDPALLELLADPDERSSEVRVRVTRSGALAEARAAALTEAEHALAALVDVRDCPERDALARIAGALAARVR